MVVQVLTPGMEHGDEPDLDAQMLGICRDDAQRLGCGLEQDRVDRRLVLEGDGGYRRRYGEYDMEVGHRKQVSLPGLQPIRTGLPLTLRTMPIAAGIVGTPNLPAGGARFDVSAERRRPAQFDGAHDATLDAAEVTRMRMAIGIAMTAENVRHLQAGWHRFGQACGGGTTSNFR